MRARWIEDQEELAGWLDAWRALAVRQGRPYCLPEWMLAWWRHAAPDGSHLRVLLLTDEQDLLGVGPFYVDRRHGLRRLRILGGGTSSSVAPLAEIGSEAALAAAVREYMAEERGAHLLLLEGVPGPEDWPGMLAGRADGNGRKVLHLASGWTQPSPKLDMGPGGYDHWFGERSSRFRARMRRGARQLESAGGRHRLIQAPDQVLEALRAFARLHGERWKDRGGSGVLSPGVARMLGEFAIEAPDHLRLWTVELDGRTISVQIFINAGGTVCHWLGGLDSSVTFLRPGAGVLSLNEALRHAWASGDRLLDFGAGGQEHKYRFADGAMQLQHVSIGRARWCAAVARLSTVPTLAKLRIRRRIPTAAKRRIRSIHRRIRSRLD